LSILLVFRAFSSDENPLFPGVGGELPIALQRRLNERVAAVVIPTQVRIVAARQ